MNERDLCLFLPPALGTNQEIEIRSSGDERQKRTMQHEFDVWNAKGEL